MSTIADILSLGRTSLTMPAMPKVDLNHYDSLVSLFVRLGACYLCHVDCTGCPRKKCVLKILGILGQAQKGPE